MIHYEHECNMINQCQEMRHEDKDGNLTECLTIFWLGIMKKTDWIKEKERTQVLKWIEDSEYKRKMIEKYLYEKEVDYLFLRKIELYDNCDEACERIEDWRNVIIQIEGERRVSGALLKSRDVTEELNL